jgi:uncharacterized membrane protein
VFHVSWICPFISLPGPPVTAPPGDNGQLPLDKSFATAGNIDFYPRLAQKITPDRSAWGNALTTEHASGLIRRIWVAIIAACSLAGAAKADLKLCNATPSRIGVALGYQDRKGWATEGWWNIPAETCENLLKGTLPSRYIYVHAIDYERGGEWSGEHTMCTKERSFTIRNTKDCEGRGYRTRGFYEIDTGTSQSWTIRLADPKNTKPKE